MTEKMMIKKTGLALLGLVIGMAFMGGPSAAAQPVPATGGSHCKASCNGDKTCLKNCRKEKKQKKRDAKHLR